MAILMKSETFCLGGSLTNGEHDEAANILGNTTGGLSITSRIAGVIKFLPRFGGREMNNRTGFDWTLLLRRMILSLFAFLALPATYVFAQSAPSFAICDVRVFDGVRTLEHRTVLVKDGKIVRIGNAHMKLPQSTEVIDGARLTLLPGLIDAHVHVGEPVRDALRDALTFGVTTELDMWTDAGRLKQMKEIAAEDPPDVADVRSAGIGATVPGGHPTQMGGPPFPTISSPSEAQSFVDARIAEGSDYIKIIHDGLTTGPDTSVALMKALIDAAHRRGKLAVVHARSEKAAREAIAAGADGLAHVFVGDAASPDFGRFAASHHVFIVPTLVTNYWACGRSTGPALAKDPQLSPYLSSQRKAMLGILGGTSNCTLASDAAIKELIAARVPVIAGTDAPIPSTAYGASLHEEIALYVQLGMRPEKALAAATSVAARRFGLRDRGIIRPGMRADLLLVSGDPTQNIQATRSIVGIWKRGIKFERKPAT
jgi:imidazolonepropionase-like amidohydrolase